MRCRSKACRLGNLRPQQKQELRHLQSPRQEWPVALAAPDDSWRSRVPVQDWPSHRPLSRRPT